MNQRTGNWEMAKKRNDTGRPRRTRDLAIDDLIRDRIRSLIEASESDTFASISELLGRNHAYIHQYVHRKTPRALREEDRRRIAGHFRIPPNTLYVGEGYEAASGKDNAQSSHAGEIRAPGFTTFSVISQDDNGPARQIGFSDSLVRALTQGRVYDDMVLVEVEGDTMTPTLADGDLVLVAIDGQAPLRDGLYALNINGAILPKRLSVGPDGQSLVVSSDNSLYNGWHNCNAADLDILGPILWCGRKL